MSCVIPFHVMPHRVMSFLVSCHIVSCLVLQEELSAALADILKSIKVSEKGVFVQASTLGSLEALLEFLRESKIPVRKILDVF